MISSFIEQKREPYLHHACPATYQDREIDGMQFWPLIPKFSSVSGTKSYNQADYIPVKMLNLGEK